MNFNDIVESMDVQLYERFKKGLELGKWPDGKKLTQQQKETCMQAIICYEDLHKINETERVGFLDRGKKANTACDPTSKKTVSEWEPDK